MIKYNFSDDSLSDSEIMGSHHILTSSSRKSSYYQPLQQPQSLQHQNRHQQYNQHHRSFVESDYNYHTTASPSEIFENEIILHRSVSSNQQPTHVPKDGFSRTVLFDPSPMIKIGNPRPMIRQESTYSEQPSMGKIFKTSSK